MHRSWFAAPFLLALAVPSVGEEAVAQTPPVTSSEVSVSSAAATLRVELTEEEVLEISLRDGTVEVDGTSVGSYSPGAALDEAWRDFLSEAVRVGPQELSTRLAEWTPPSGLDPEEAAAAQALASTLEDRLARAASPPGPPNGLAILDGQTDDVLRALLLRPQRLRQLSEVLEGLDVTELEIRVGENVVIGPEESIPATLVVVDGHVISLGGTVELGEEGEITGDLRWRNGEIRGSREIVAGTLSEVEDLRTQIEAQVREQLARDLPRQVQEAAPPATDRGWLGRIIRSDGFRPLGHILGGLGGLIQTAVTYVVLLLLASGVVAFFPQNLEIISETARREPGRSALVGVAGFVLFFPAWILGIVGLAISIIGIPLLLIWTPAFPLAFVLAGALGFLAVAYQAGGWFADRRIQGFDWTDRSTPFQQLALGLGLFVAAFAAASIVQMAGPWLGFFQGLLRFLGVMAVLAAVTVGMGAVLLSRAGRIRPYATGVADSPGGGPGSPPGGSGTPPMDDEVEEWEREFQEARGETPPSAGSTARSGGHGEGPPPSSSDGETESDGEEPERG